MPARSGLIDHRSWGLDSPRANGATAGLCTIRGHPNWWDLLPRVGNSGGAVPPLTDDNRKALALCRQCPIQRRCLEEYAALPVSVRASHIAGGVVWGSKGQRIWGGW